MASTINQRLLERVRMDLGDLPQPFDFQFVGDGVRDHFNVEHRPFDPTSLVLLFEGTPVDPVTAKVTIDGLTGTLVFDEPPAAGEPWEIQGQKWRYFSDEDLQIFIDTSVGQHAHNRADSSGGPYDTGDIPPVEEYPIALYAVIQALWALATDASFDIDILAPDGVNIPRSERYRQLMDMIGARQTQYDEIAKALNIGISRLETVTVRRTAKLTNRLVPVFMPQEYDDRTPPRRLYLPISTQGTAPVPISKGTYDIYLYSDEPFSVQMNFQTSSTDYPVTPGNDPYDMTNWEFFAPIVRMKGSKGPVITELDVRVLNADTGLIQLTLDSDQVKKVPNWCFWEFRTRVPNTTWFTRMRGEVRREYGMTRTGRP
jgi:hypothetical protein